MIVNGYKNDEEGNTKITVLVSNDEILKERGAHLETLIIQTIAQEWVRENYHDVVRNLKIENVGNEVVKSVIELISTNISAKVKKTIFGGM